MFFSDSSDDLPLNNLKRFYRLPLGVICVGLAFAQGMIMNHYLVLNYDTSWYAWVVADVISSAMLGFAVFKSWRFHRRIRPVTRQCESYMN